jgi:dTDP-4-dehydrorhamnose reductase
MSETSAVLVVGGDSLVGGGLLAALRRRGRRAYATTRRPETVNESRIFLDFQNPEDFQLPLNVDHAVILAAAADYTLCATDPMARVVNVELIPRCVAALMERGCFVSFVSTNTVFGGERPWPGEDDPHAPGIPYAEQKHEAEERIAALADRLGLRQMMSVVRLTKILDRSTPPLPAWFAGWERGEVVTPFADLVFAPMSISFVGEALATLAEKNIPGNLHLSGADNVSYVTFAEAIAGAMGVDKKLIAPTTASERGVHIAFKPTYSGLGMERTTRLSGIMPQTIDEVVTDLLGDNPA